MASPDAHAEAYDTLGALHSATSQAKAELEQSIEEITTRASELAAQLREAIDQGDETAIERVQAEIAELHKAFIVAQEELDHYQSDDDEQDQTDQTDHPQEDSTDASTDLPAPHDGLGPMGES